MLCSSNLVQGAHAGWHPSDHRHLTCGKEVWEDLAHCHSEGRPSRLEQLDHCNVFLAAVAHYLYHPSLSRHAMGIVKVLQHAARHISKGPWLSA